MLKAENDALRDDPFAAGRQLICTSGGHDGSIWWNHPPAWIMQPPPTDYR